MYRSFTETGTILLSVWANTGFQNEPLFCHIRLVRPGRFCLPPRISRTVLWGTWNGCILPGLSHRSEIKNVRFCSGQPPGLVLHHAELLKGTARIMQTCSVAAV